MKVTLLQTAFVFIFSLLQLTLFAQSLSNYGGGGISGDSKKTSISSIAGTWEAGVMLGPDFYYGDLNPNKFWPGHSVSAAGGIFVMRQFTDVIGIKGTLFVGGIRGSKDRTEGSLSVNRIAKGTFFDFTVNSVFNFSNLFSPSYDGRKIFVYGTIGLGFNAWNTKLTENVNGEVIIPSQVNGLQAGFVVPVGLGAQYAITSKISAGIEYTVRTVFSDLVDQTSGGFKYDFVNILAFTASYRIGIPKKKLNIQEYPYSSPRTYQSTATPEPVRPAMALPVPQASASEPYDYVVQICAYSKHDYTVAWVKKHYRVDMPVSKESENGLNRYVIGNVYHNLNEARELCDRLRKKGIDDAWVIAYQNGKRHHVVVY